MELSPVQEAVLELKDRLLYKLRKLLHKFEGTRYSFRNKLPEPNVYAPSLFVKRVHPYVFVGLELRESSTKPSMLALVKEMNLLLQSMAFNELVDTSPNSYKAVLVKNNLTAIVTTFHDKGSAMAVYLEVFSEDIYD